MYANEQKADFRGNTIRSFIDGWRIRGRSNMNRDRFRGIWKQFSGKVKERWGRLTDDPLALAAGTRDRLAGRIQEQHGLSKQEADRQLEDFMTRNRNWCDLSKPERSRPS